MPMTSRRCHIVGPSIRVEGEYCRVQEVKLITPTQLSWTGGYHRPGRIAEWFYLGGEHVILGDYSTRGTGGRQTRTSHVLPDGGQGFILEPTTNRQMQTIFNK